MSTPWKEQLAQIEREIAAQNRRWAETKSKLRDLGDEEIRVPIGAFEELEPVAPRFAAAPRTYLLRG